MDYYYIEHKDLLIVVFKHYTPIQTYNELIDELKTDIKQTSGIENVLVLQGDFQIIK